MFDAATSILTAIGWVKLSDLTADHRIAQFEPLDARLVSYEPAISVALQEYDGNTLLLDGLRLTPDTRLYVSRSHAPTRRYQPQFELCRADERFHGTKRLWQTPLRVRRGASGTRLLTEDFAPFLLTPLELARLLGFAAGDGDARRSSAHKLRFQLTKLRKVSYLSTICNHAQMGLTLAMRQGQYCTIEHPGIGRWFAENIYIPGTTTKTLPPVLLEQSQAVLLALLDGLRNSDGYTYANPECWQFATTSPYLAAMLQAVGVITGLPFSCYKHEDCYRLYTQTVRHMPHVNDARTRHYVQQVPFAGTLYRLTTRTGLVAVRYDDKTLLMGTD
jgi:hypothetical protein